MKPPGGAAALFPLSPTGGEGRGEGACGSLQPRHSFP